MNIIKKKDGFRDERHIIIPAEQLKTASTHPLIQGTYLVELGYYPNAKYHYRERHYGANEYILIFCLDGKGTIQLNNADIYTMERGNIFCIPKNVPHRYYSDEEDPWTIIWSHFCTDFSQEFSINDAQKINIQSSSKSSQIQHYFIDLFNVSEKVTTDKTVIHTSQLLKVILSEIYFLDDKLEDDAQNKYLTKCMKYMHKNLEKELTLNELANHLKISPSYLSSLFKKYTGKSPIEYLIEIRVEQACKYLKLSNLKNYEIAKKVGYQDPYYFSRIFKKVTNYSPNDYRKMMTVKNTDKLF